VLMRTIYMVRCLAIGKGKYDRMHNNRFAEDRLVFPD
jgi:hypothetical protein